MNFRYNPRGGLVADRRELHRSAEYARQVAALRQISRRMASVTGADRAQGGKKSAPATE